MNKMTEEKTEEKTEVLNIYEDFNLDENTICISDLNFCKCFYCRKKKEHFLQLFKEPNTHPNAIKSSENVV